MHDGSHIEVLTQNSNMRYSLGMKLTCPICGKAGITPAHILGHSCKGSPKTLSKAERARRSERMSVARAARWPKKEAK